MANHKSSIKRIRSSETRRIQNRYQVQTMRNALKTLRAEKDKEKAGKMYVEVSSMLDKLAKKNVIHKKKASNLKSSLSLQVNGL